MAYVRNGILTLYGAMSENRQNNFRLPTPSREEAAQACLIDVWRTLSVKKRR